MRITMVADISSFNGSKRYRNQAGYLVLPDCKIACSGILQYSNVKGQDGKLVCNGELINVYRPPAALKGCLNQYSGLPLTTNHPAGQEVNPNIAKGLTVGALGTNPQYTEEGGKAFIVCDIIVYDADAQEKIENGELVELSAGYATAFRAVRGEYNGEAYEAEQFLLEPNHVALVEAGRCGSECRVCDNKDFNPEINKGEKRMQVKKTKRVSYRYFMPVGDAGEVVELTEEQANSMIEKDPEVEVEELDENEVKLEEEVKDIDNEDEEIEVAGVETDPDEDNDDDDEDTKVEVEEDEEENEMVFQVQFDDGTIGKMDKVAYEHCQRLMEVNKRGDKKETSFAQGMVLTSCAREVLGSDFKIEKYVKGDNVDTGAIKSAVVRKVYPNIVIKGVKADALDALYRSAYETFTKNRNEYHNDLSALCDVPRTVAAGDASDETIASKARKAFLDRLHGKN